MRVVVTRISQDGAMRRRMVDTAVSGDVGPWEELIARALAAPPPYCPVPGGPVYHLRVDDQVVLVAEHELSGPLYDLVTAVLAIGEAPHLADDQPVGQSAPDRVSKYREDSGCACRKIRRYARTLAR